MAVDQAPLAGAEPDIQSTRVSALCTLGSLKQINSNFSENSGILSGPAQLRLDPPLVVRGGGGGARRDAGRSWRRGEEEIKRGYFAD